jgi:hypothetical protein
MFHPRRTVALAAAALLCAGCFPLLTWRAAVRGRVIDELTGRPVPSLRVRLGYEGDSSLAQRRLWGDEKEVVTDANGEFFVPGYKRLVFLVLGNYAAFHPWFVFSYPPYEQYVHCCYRVERSSPRTYTLIICSSRPCLAPPEQ